MLEIKFPFDFLNFFLTFLPTHEEFSGTKIYATCM